MTGTHNVISTCIYIFSIIVSPLAQLVILSNVHTVVACFKAHRCSIIVPQMSRDAVPIKSGKFTWTIDATLIYLLKHMLI